MKLFLVVALGMVASFGLTILAELVRFNSTTIGGWWLHPALPGVTVVVGIIVGLASGKQAPLAAALSLAPWNVWLVVAVNAGHSTMLRWASTIALVSVHFALGVGAAVLVARAMAKRRQQSPSQRHA